MPTYPPLGFGAGCGCVYFDSPLLKRTDLGCVCPLSFSQVWGLVRDCVFFIYYFYSSIYFCFLFISRESRPPISRFSACIVFQQGKGSKPQVLSSSRSSQTPVLGMMYDLTAVSLCLTDKFFSTTYGWNWDITSMCTPGSSEMTRESLFAAAFQHFQGICLFFTVQIIYPYFFLSYSPSDNQLSKQLLCF